MSILLFFIDGIGIGEFDPAINPFARYPSPFFPFFKNYNSGNLPLAGVMVPTDVSMGVGGLPQSATGQTALLTGVNAAKLIGRHHPGFPTVRLRKLLIDEESIFLKIENRGKTGTFANAFTPEYFQRSDRSISASTWSLKASNFPFRWLQPDLWQERAISHDLTNEFLCKRGYEAPRKTPEQAAQILADITQSVDFCLFEYFLTDAIGHGQDMDWAQKELDKLNRFLEKLLTTLPLAKNTVIITSDHGNFEDFSVMTHTGNLVPTTIWGKQKELIAANSRKIEDITGAILTNIFEAESRGKRV